MAEHRTDRLVLEPLDVRHADALHEALRDPSVHAFIETSGPWTLEAVRGRLARLAEGPPPGSDDVWLNFAVLLGDRLVGRVEATVHPLPNRPLAEVAYLFDPAVSGHGYRGRVLRRGGRGVPARAGLTPVMRAR